MKRRKENMNKKRVQIIPDVHCREAIFDIIDHSVDEFVFLGDYLDSYTAGDDIMVSCFSKIIDFKNEHFDKTTLLIGNHIS